MTKSIEDYPELDKWLDSVTYLDDLHLETDEDESCCRSDVEQKLLEMQATIDAQQERISEFERVIGEVDHYLNMNCLTHIMSGSIFHKEFKRLLNKESK